MGPRPATRERLMDAALALVARRGLDGTPVTAIEAQAGLRPGNGSFYRHFSSKEEVVSAAVQREVERVRAMVPQESAAGSLADRFRDDLELLRALGPLIAILARDRDRLPQVVSSVRDSLLEGGLLDYAQLLDSRAPAGAGGNAPAAKEAGAVVLAALVGYHLSVQYFGGDPGGVTPEAFAGALAALVAPGTVGGTPTPVGGAPGS